MTHHETITPVQTRRSTALFTPTRTKWIGFVTLLWSFAFAALVFTYNALDVGIAFEAGSFQSWTIYFPHAVAYLVTLVVLLAANARYGFGRLGSAFVYGYCGLLAVLAAGMITGELAPAWGPGAVATGIGFVGIHLLAPIVGVVLWRTEGVSTLAAALFVAVVPTIGVVLAVDALVGINLTAGAFEIALALGAAVLGYQLWIDGLEREFAAAVESE